MSSNNSNIAAYQTSFKSRPFALQPAPMPTPKPAQIVIRSHAIGINPTDAAVQNLGMVYTADKFPIVPGFDVAGTVHAVGEDVTRFKPGDRVCAFTIDMSKDKMETACENGAFQLFCVANENFAAKVPENVEFAEAAVFPSCLTTAAYSLFVKDAMALDLPPIDGPSKPNGKVLVVWGGSSVVGSCAIQMATLAGYSVVATSSEMNFGHCRALGAEKMFDYKSASVVEDIVAACKATGKESAGAFVAYFNDESTVKCSQIVSQLEGGSKIVGTVVPPHLPVPEGVAEGVKIAPSKFFSCSTDPSHRRGPELI